MDMLLETKKVTKIFGGLHANSDIDFSIDEGEIVAIIGAKRFRQDYIL